MSVIPAHTISIRDGTQPIYNGLDNCLTFEVDAARQNSRANDTLIYDAERAQQGMALEMTLRGFRVDWLAREAAIAKTGTKLAAVDKVLEAVIGGALGNYLPTFPQSPKQLQNFFYDVVKLTPIEKHFAGETTRPMDRETLEKLELQDDVTSPIINAILLRRDLAKTLQVLEKEIDDDTRPHEWPPNWRWRCSYNLGGSTTGRWSSSKSPFGTAGNFQNITEELRRIFIPDPGMKLYGIDKAQSEARDVGWFCGVMLGDWTYLDACESGDLHTAVTRLLYPDWSWTGNLRTDRQIAERRFHRHLTFRDASKRLGHASNYLGRPQEISRQTRIPFQLVKDFQTRYFAAFPCIHRMHTWVAEHIQRERYLITMFGRRRDFFGIPKSDDTLKSAVAYMFQSATADCLNFGLYRLWKNMGRRIQILSQLHDAVYFQAPIPTSVAAEQAMLREAIGWIQITQHDRKSGRSMTIPGEIVGGFNWSHKEDWNPNGLDGIKLIEDKK